MESETRSIRFDDGSLLRLRRYYEKNRGSYRDISDCIVSLALFQLDRIEEKREA